jgi:hypothetical protein
MLRQLFNRVYHGFRVIPTAFWPAAEMTVETQIDRRFASPPFF